MSDRPAKPLDDMHYLDGYLDYVYSNDDLPDGAWFEMCKSTIAEHWDIDIDDAHEVFLSYLEWKEHEQQKRISKA